MHKVSKSKYYYANNLGHFDVQISNKIFSANPFNLHDENTNTSLKWELRRLL